MKRIQSGLMKIVVLGIIVATVTACASATATPANLAGTAAALPEEVLAGAQSRLSETLGVPAESIQIDKVEQAQWADACLELAQPGENCAQVITPGYRVMVTVDGQTYEIHTNADGSMIRVKQ